MKLYFIAGETSGDTHGAKLMHALREREATVCFYGCGGPKMQALAEPGFLDWSGEAVVGLWDVVKKYPYFKRRFKETLKEIETLRPDAVVFVDYPGFNLRMAKAIHRRFAVLGIHPPKLIYFISPQVWAWNRGRIPKMARTLDLMLCIFPFEKELYENSGLKTVFVGHPLKEKLEDKIGKQVRETNLLGLFPGSREREVRKLFPRMLQTARLLAQKHPDLRFESAAASPALQAMMEEYHQAIASELPLQIGLHTAHSLMQRATAGMVASGTATMEATFFGLPFILVYRVAAPTWWIGKHLVKVPYLGMANLLAGREIIREFLQSAVRPDQMASALEPLLYNEEQRLALQLEMQKVTDELGDSGCAERAASAILEACAIGTAA